MHQKNSPERPGRVIHRKAFKTLAGGIGLALTAWGTGSAWADSAVGVDTAIGNALNPPGRSALPRVLADDDMDTVRRSPTGQLYGIPPAAAEERALPPGAWGYGGSIELGALLGDGNTKNALFRKYKDLKNGLYLDHFDLHADQPDAARYLQVSGGGIGRNDQFVGLQFGRYNDWKLKIFYSETAHVFTDTYRSVYDGVGTDRLTLAGGLKANGGAVPVISGTPTVGTGACTTAAPCWRYTGVDGVTKVFSNATALVGINWTGGAVVAAGTPVSPNSIAGAINNYLGGVPGNTELGLVRQKVGSMAEVNLSRRWKAYAGYSNEHRTGARPFGMNENNYTVELPEPIDYTTHDFLAGLSYTDPLTQANLRSSASLFRNRVSTLTVDHPWLAAATGVAAAQTTIFDLYPDNSAFNVKGEFARSLPDFMKGRFTASLAWGSSRQNDSLLMPVDPSQSAQIRGALGSPVLQGINNAGYGLNTLDLRNWDGTNGSPLSRSTAGQRIDSRLANVALSLRPLDDLGLKAEWRQHLTDNRGGYTAYNPLTGQFGRGFRNSTAFDLVVGSTGAPGAVGVPCYAPDGFAPVAGCSFNGNAGVAGQGTNNPANVPVFSPPRDIRQDNLGLSADYDLRAGQSLSAALERETLHRSYREREKTWEDKVKLGYVNRAMEDATLRLSYEVTQRRGTEYEFWPIDDFGTGLPGLDWNTIVTQYQKTTATAPGWVVAPASVSGYLARYAYESRKYDQADRDQRVFNARLNYIPREDMDLGLTLQHRDLNYPESGYGLRHDSSQSVSVDLNYQPSTQQQISGYYTSQLGNKLMRANAGTNAAGASNACIFPVGSSLSLSQVVEQCAAQVWLPAAEWDFRAKDRTDVFGLGWQIALGRSRLGLDYVYTTSRSDATYSYGPNVLTAALAPLAAAPYPSMRLIQNSLSAHLLVPIDKRLSAHLMLRHENGRVQDWHYDGVPMGASAAEGQATLMLDAGPQNYRANIFGVMLQIKL